MAIRLWVAYLGQSSSILFPYISVKSCVVGIRWNFNDFFHAFFLIFRVVSAADCVEPLYDCLPANGLTCLGIFLPSLYLGTFVVSVHTCGTMHTCVTFTHLCLSVRALNTLMCCVHVL